MRTNDQPYGIAPDFDKALFEQVSQSIAEHGVQLIAVYESSDGDYKPFVYTIGLSERGGDEIIAFADSEEELNAIAELLYRIARREWPLDPQELLRYGHGTLTLAAPDADFDAFLQEHCLVEARNYYRCDRVDVLVALAERDLRGPHQSLH